jgi:hypothetical protein
VESSVIPPGTVPAAGALTSAFAPRAAARTSGSDRLRPATYPWHIAWQFGSLQVTHVQARSWPTATLRPARSPSRNKGVSEVGSTGGPSLNALPTASMRPANGSADPVSP